MKETIYLSHDHMIYTYFMLLQATVKHITPKYWDQTWCV